MIPRNARPESSMIPRYTRPEMAAIWEGADALQDLVRNRGACGDAQAELGVIPKEAAKAIWAKARDAIFDVARIDEIERETKHDVIAFTTHLAEIVGPEARFVHQGMTSSDVLDTCLNVQLTRAADILIADIDKVLAALKKRAFEHKMTPTNRPLARHPCRTRDVRAQARLRLCRIQPRSRAPGDRAQGGRDLRDLGRGGHFRADRSTRGSACRQGHGAGAGADLHPGDPARSPRNVFCNAGRDRLLGRAACHRNPSSSAHRSVGSRGILLRGPEGLSAMPHKRNPVLSENLTGLSRMVRAYVTRRWRMWCCGTSAISHTPQPSA